MRRPLPLLPALAAVLLLTACGSEQAGTRNGGVDASGSTPRTQVTQPAVDGVRITSVTTPSASASPSASDGGLVKAERLPTGLAADSGISAAYEVTNSGTEALTYTVRFDFTTSAGEVMSNERVTVRSVGAGRTVRGTVRPGELVPGASPVTTVKVAEVTKVPAGEAPTEAGVCPPSGVRVSADDGDAAMGLRVVGLILENCGDRDYTVDGYPQVTLLDEDHKTVDGVKIFKGSGGISTVTGFDDPPRPVTLKPGERANAGLMWRNTTGSGTAVDVPYVRVRARSGAEPVMVTPHLDLGTTGKLGVSPWRSTPE
ncbi:DUF4232 domain-containing protein [Streptomyces sp. NBC_00015]|uniref:DUF4232 domain-containing protein n=1 Tax=unclassified Streptomyces TaxID=2593676 RepID=UPI0022566352|nr:DUF4232 domain-containing protein [Streptomyces sp. NBC_00103]MCX5371536.1 DUF4232 domain-containing protein [Streptomyces sp. NBC_00103]